MHPTNLVFLSVIIPVYNRETLVQRAIQSVVRNADTDFEILVVDDASTDGTAERVRAIANADARIHLLSLPTNRGVCVARNTGAQHARGKWLVFLDSDDELTPEGLSIIRERARTASPSVAKLKLSCRSVDGAISPKPLLDGRVVDYEGFLRWSETTVGGRSETLPCVRRAAFLDVPYDEEPGWFEALHELNFVRRYHVQLCADVVRIYHGDAPERLMVPRTDSPIAGVRAMLAHTEAVVEAHIDAFDQHAPVRAFMLRRELATLTFLAGQRVKGVQRSLHALRHSLFNAATWGVLFVGLASPTMLRLMWLARRERSLG